MRNWLASLNEGSRVKLMPVGVEMVVESADEHHLYLVPTDRPVTDRFMVRRTSGQHNLGQLWIESPEPVGLPLDTTQGWEAA